jgi:cyclic pyranopterin phosphate synthase
MDTDTDASLPVFPFEEIGSELDLVPLAARRALDLSGFRVSLEGWRSLALEDRRRLVRAGAEDTVDAQEVFEIVRRASPLAQPIERAPDPDPGTLPKGVPSVVLPLARWSTLRPVERFALAHACQSAIKRSDPAIFEAAHKAIIGPSRLTDEGALGGAGGAASGAEGDVEETAAVSDVLSIPFSSTAVTVAEIAPTEEALLPPPITEPEAWTSRAMPRDDEQPGLSPAASSSPGSAVLPMPARPRTTLVSAPDHDGESDPTALSSHLDASGAAHMVDVSPKSVTQRRAVAAGKVRMRPETGLRIMRADAPKGEVIGAARIAGIMAAKRTPELIPLCHGIALTHVTVDIQVVVDELSAEARVTATAEALDRTGVEMEAMVAVSVACLTIYDMLKGIDRAMTISDVRLLEKSGGRSGHFIRGDAQA